MAARRLKIKDNTLALFYALNDGKSHSQKEICEEWLIPRTTINTIVKECTASGFMVLENHPHTKEKRIVLTEKGRRYADQILKSVYQAEENAMEQTLEEFSPKLIDGLEAFTRHLKEEFQKKIFDREDKDPAR